MLLIYESRSAGRQDNDLHTPHELQYHSVLLGNIQQWHKIFFKSHRANTESYKMPHTKHIITFTVSEQGNQQINCQTNTDVSPIPGLDLVEIEFRGTPLMDMREEVSISEGAFVIINLKLSGRRGLTPQFVSLTIDGIENARLVFSSNGVYPMNIDPDTPVFEDLKDSVALQSDLDMVSFIEYIGRPLEAEPKSERQTQIQLW